MVSLWQLGATLEELGLMIWLGATRGARACKQVASRWPQCDPNYAMFFHINQKQAFIEASDRTLSVCCRWRYGLHLRMVSKTKYSITIVAKTLNIS